MKGVGDACTMLKQANYEGKKLLSRMKDTLKQACDARRFDTCYLRGELDFGAGKINESEVWYKRSKTLATNVKSRCDAKKEPSIAACSQALKTLKDAGAREDEITKLRLQD